MYTDALICWLRRVYKPQRIHSRFKDEFVRKTSEINFYRLKISTYATILLLLLGLGIDIFIYKDRWSTIPAYRSLFFIHAFAFLLVILLPILYHTIDKEILTKNMNLHYIFIFFQLTLNGIASINAQFIHGQITAYIISLICVSSIFLLNKIEGLIIISLSYITFVVGLIAYHNNDVGLAGNITNSLTAAICSFVISQVFYRKHVKEFLINKELKNALKMKDEFLSLMSHELKTPLTVINSAIQAIDFLCKDEMSDRLKGYMGNIRQNSNRQLRLVNNILDITRTNAGRIKIKKENVDIVFLSKAIVESVNLYSKGKGINLSFSASFDKKIIGIDEEKYERILLNLLSNAIKFTPCGKSIKVNLSCKGDNILLEVHDQGVGIPADKMDLIFERFGQVDSSLSRQAEGTGIGLSLVKLFVEALNGSISVESELGKGSTFSILLPAAKVVKEDINIGLMDCTDTRIVQSVNIELSDIYFRDILT